MRIDRESVKRVLLITLSNLGDIILTTPVLASIRKEFPEARIDVMTGPAGKEVFEKDPDIFKVIIYNKHIPIAAKRRIELKLKKLRYDLVVDLRNTVFGILIGPKYRTRTIQSFPVNVIHSIDKHLHRLKSIGIKNIVRKPYIYISKEDEDYIEGLLKADGVSDNFIVINPGAKSHLKRWTAEGFVELINMFLKEGKFDVVLVGSREDEVTAADIIIRVEGKVHNFVTKTSVRQLAALLKRSRLLITNDSAPLHLASAVGARVLAIFGPTDPRRYGPIGDNDVVINKKLPCSPCEKAFCKFNYECMKSIKAKDVYEAAKLMIENYG